MTNEVEFANAVKSLTARLEAWGITEPHDKAHAYIRDMIRNGWRPTGYRYEEPPSYRPTPTPPPESALALARANLTQAKAGLCSHGISPRICKDVHDEETT